jgi:shikimate dehydrogenase
MTDRYAVIGNPVAHSRSPQIHAEFARQTGQTLTYHRLLAPLDRFADAVAQFREEQGRGANVTVPFKEDAYRLAGGLSDRAKCARAVNTLRFDADEVFGDNTDGAGLMRDIRANLGIELAGKRILLLGAGGAARGTMAPLLAQGPAGVTIANRTVDRARALATQFDVGFARYEALGESRFDIVLNATSSGLSDDPLPLPPGVFEQCRLAYDLMYGKGDTAFLAKARAEGAGTIADGLGMLVEQAAESFFVWRGVRPETAPVLRALRQEAARPASSPPRQ